MSFKYIEKHLRVGESVTLKDGDMMVGSTLIQDAPFRFHVIAHVLERTDAEALPTAHETKELTQ